LFGEVIEGEYILIGLFDRGKLLIIASGTENRLPIYSEVTQCVIRNLVQGIRNTVEGSTDWTLWRGLSDNSSGCFGGSA
jgi:hypothetical protein